MHFRVHEASTGENCVAESAARFTETRSEIDVESRELLELLHLIMEAHLPRLPMDFFEADDIRLHGANHRGDLLDMSSVVELIVAGDVVGHHQKRFCLLRKVDPFRETHDLSALVSREQAKIRIDGLGPA